MIRVIRESRCGHKHSRLCHNDIQADRFHKRRFARRINAIQQNTVLMKRNIIADILKVILYPLYNRMPQMRRFNERRLA